jgi:hypothetical protein
VAVNEVLIRRGSAGGELHIAKIISPPAKGAKTIRVAGAGGHEERVPFDAKTDLVADEESKTHECARDPAALRARFDRDAQGVFVDLIKDGRGKPISTAKIKKTLAVLGLTESKVTTEWKASLAGVKQHEHIVAKGSNYSWTETPRDPHAEIRKMSPSVALDRLTRGRVPTDQKPILIDIIRASLASGKGGGAPGGSRAEAARTAELRAVQDQKVRTEGIRALAELAMEVEELVADGTAADVVIERVRQIAGAQRLTAVGTAGQATSFDRQRHSPIIGSPKDGAKVTVVRPGYSWRPADEDVLVAKAQVIEE